MEAESIKDSLQSGRDARSPDKTDAEAAVPLKPSVDKEMKTQVAVVIINQLGSDYSVAPAKSGLNP